MKKIFSGGYTLPEILIVMVLMSILSASGWYSWQQWQQKRQLDDSAQQIQRLLQRLRADANWHNRVYLLWLQPGPRWCLGAGQQSVDCLSAPRLRLQAPWPGTEITTLTPGIGFYGRKNVARPGRIVIVSKAGERRIIVSARGRIRICRQSEQLCG